MHIGSSRRKGTTCPALMAAAVSRVHTVPGAEGPGCGPKDVAVSVLRRNAAALEPCARAV